MKFIENNKFNCVEYPVKKASPRISDSTETDYVYVSNFFQFYRLLDTSVSSLSNIRIVGSRDNDRFYCGS